MTKRTVSRTRLALILVLCFVLVAVASALIATLTSSDNALAAETSDVKLTGSVAVSNTKATLKNGKYVFAAGETDRKATVTVTYNLTAKNFWVLEVNVAKIEGFTLTDVKAAKIGNYDGVVSDKSVWDEKVMVLWQGPGSSGTSTDNVCNVTSLLTLTYTAENVTDRKSTRLNSSHCRISRMPSSA